ncbi:hypothetical protein AWV79_03960 [Cupriavidus sp. UYMMa02A]|nr:hypothetical protein AWV79_03960 [Cupriavidus sp. UYMMa02A]
MVFQATLTQRIEQDSRGKLDLQNQLESLCQELARLRGQNEGIRGILWGRCRSSRRTATPTWMRD